VLAEQRRRLVIADGVALSLIGLPTSFAVTPAAALSIATVAAAWLRALRSSAGRSSVSAPVNTSGS
jgi:hypothetical protein